jgi:hypothetical protein
VKRFAKILLAGLLVIFLLIAGLTIYIQIKYPAERLKELLIAMLAEEYGIHVTIDRLGFNLFSGFEIEKLRILGEPGERRQVLEAYLSPLQVEKVTFSYRWRSLLARKLEIDEIIITQPTFVFWQAPDRTTNLDALFVAYVDSTAAPRDTSTAGLPISTHLKTLSLRNLQIKAALASAVDTQFVELGQIDAEVSEIAIDRQANYRAKFKLLGDPVHLSYVTIPLERGSATSLRSELESRFEGSLAGDSVEARVELAFDHGYLNFGDSIRTPLPQMSATLRAYFNIASSHLVIPEIRFALDGREQLAARFEMDQRNGAPNFKCHVNRGGLDLDQLSRIVQAYAKTGVLPGLKGLKLGGYLEFSDSELQGDTSSMRYRLVLRGRDLMCEDSSTGLKIDRAQLQMDWRPIADAFAGDHATELSGKLGFAAFDVPLDTLSVLNSGPGELEIKFLLDKDFFPRQGDLKFSWQHFAGGSLRGYAKIQPAPNYSTNNETWLSRLSAEAEISADAVELSPLSAGTVKGKIGGKIELNGKQLEALALTCNMRNAPLTYDDGIEYKGRIPPYQLSASAKMKVDHELTRVTFEDGIVQGEPGTVRFRADYDIDREAFRFDITDTALDLAHVVKVLPDTIFAGLGPLLVMGSAPTEGWLEGKFLTPDSLEYSGFFKTRADNATYHDSTLGIYADNVKIDSEWSLTTTTTTGKYALFCPAPRFPDYLPVSLPPTTATGEIFVDLKTFTIKEGKLDIPDWQISGNYKVDGEFLPEGMQVTTAADLKLHADKTIVLSPGVELKGNVETEFQYDQYLPNAIEAPQPANLTGWLKVDGLHLTVDTLLALRDLNVYCDFAQDFVYVGEELSLKPAGERPAAGFANAGEALLLYDIFGDVRRDNVMRKNVMRNNAGQSSRLTIAQLNVLGYQISDIQADLVIGNCRLDIPQLRMNLFGGNMVGNLLVDLGNGNPDEISYATTLQISSIDVSRFRRLGAEVEKGSKLSADFYLSGLGTSPEKLDEIVSYLAGRLNITKIEKKVALNLLQFLDPKGTDAGIQRMRLLLKTGWNVKQITFEIKNGFVYASLKPVKPWFAPFTLPTTLDFARLPIRYFLETTTEE